MIVIGAFLSAYLGYLVNGAWKQGMEFAAFMEAFEEVLSYPLRDYYNSGTIKAVVIALIIYAVAVIMYYTFLLCCLHPDHLDFLEGACTVFVATFSYCSRTPFDTGS